MAQPPIVHAVFDSNLIGIRLSGPDLPSALSELSERVERGQGGYACFVNVHTLTESTTNESLRAALEHATFCFPDGMPLVWLMRLKGSSIGGRISGPDFTREFATAQRARSQGLVGGAPGRAEELASALGITACVYSPPMRDFSVENALEDWKAFLQHCPGGKAPSIVWVGLGAPKQEVWMQAVSRHAPETFFFGVGAAFDFLAGHVRRAPAWMRNNGLEWVHRLSQDPRRLWKRYLRTNAKFALLALRELTRQ